MFFGSAVCEMGAPARDLKLLYSNMGSIGIEYILGFYWIMENVMEATRL